MSVKHITNVQKIALKTNSIEDINECEYISAFFADVFVNHLYKVALTRVGSDRNKLADEYRSVITINFNDFTKNVASQDRTIDNFCSFYDHYRKRDVASDKSEIIARISRIFSTDTEKLSNTQKYEIVCNVFAMLMSKLVAYVSTSNVLAFILSDRTTAQAKSTFQKNSRAVQDFCISTLLEYKIELKTKLSSNDSSHYVKEIKKLKKTCQELTDEADELYEINDKLKARLKKCESANKTLTEVNERLSGLVEAMHRRHTMQQSATNRITEISESPAPTLPSPVKPVVVTPAPAPKPAPRPILQPNKPTLLMPTMLQPRPIIPVQPSSLPTVHEVSSEKSSSESESETEPEPTPVKATESSKPFAAINLINSICHSDDDDD